MNVKFKRIIKGIVFALSAIVLVMFSIYSMAWYTFTKRAEVYMNMGWQDKANYTVTGEIPDFTGYPFVPTAKFAGTIEHGSGLKIETPEIIFSGFPAPRQIQTLDAPHGLKISGDILERDLTFDYAFLQFRGPRIPSSNRQEDVESWQKAGHDVTIEQIILKAGNVYARGSGTMGLDDKLQLTADITVRVIGMESLFDTLAADKGEKSIAMARSFFQMISQIDAKTGEKYFETTLKIQNRGLYFGPMRISGLPEITWKSEKPPVVPSRSPLNRPQ